MVVDEVVDVVYVDWNWSYYSSSEDDDVSIHAENAAQSLRIEAECATIAQHTTVACPSVVYSETLVANRDTQAPGAYYSEEILEDYQEALSYFRKTKVASTSRAYVQTDHDCTDICPASPRNEEAAAPSSPPRAELQL